jgi:segregation and condensation protein B
MALSLPHTLEALLFASGEAMPKNRIASLLSITPEMLAAATTELKTELVNRGIALIETNDELELRTSPDAAVIVEAFRKGELSRDLGKAGLEALAIILYQNGATRSEVDWIRGVNSTAAIRSLLLRGLIERETDTEDKRRIRYTPSVEAYAHLGIRGPEELPNAEALRGMLSQHAPEVGAALAEVAETE